MTSLELILWEILLTIVVYGSLGLLVLFLGNKLIDDHFKRQTNFKVNMMMIEHQAEHNARMTMLEYNPKITKLKDNKEDEST